MGDRPPGRVELLVAPYATAGSHKGFALVKNPLALPWRRAVVMPKGCGVGALVSKVVSLTGLHSFNDVNEETLHMYVKLHELKPTWAARPGAPPAVDRSLRSLGTCPGFSVRAILGVDDLVDILTELFSKGDDALRMSPSTHKYRNDDGTDNYELAVLYEVLRRPEGEVTGRHHALGWNTSAVCSMYVAGRARWARRGACTHAR